MPISLYAGKPSIIALAEYPAMGLQRRVPNRIAFERSRCGGGGNPANVAGVPNERKSRARGDQSLARSRPSS